MTTIIFRTSPRHVVLIGNCAKRRTCRKQFSLLPFPSEWHWSSFSFFWWYFLFGRTTFRGHVTDLFGRSEPVRWSSRTLHSLAGQAGAFNQYQFRQSTGDCININSAFRAGGAGFGFWSRHKHHSDTFVA